jgi:hypothetical protein
MRDLEFPKDAERVVASLHRGLEYDAALAVMGLACQELALLSGNKPDLSVPIRSSGREADEAVRKDAPELLSRLAFTTMVSRIDSAAQRLLLQRRVLEEVAITGKRFEPGGLWPILRRLNKEYRRGPVALCCELVVEQPSAELTRRMKWLSGLVDVRNCITHRLGQVQLIDTVPHGASIENVKESDRLRALWLRPKFLVDGKEVTFPYTNNEGRELKASLDFDEYEREWKVGDVIHITPQECQAIGMSLALLGNILLADFIREMTIRLQSSQKLNLPKTGEINMRI